MSDCNENGTEDTAAATRPTPNARPAERSRGETVSARSHEHLPKSRWKRTDAWYARNRPIYERVKVRLQADAPDIFYDHHPLPLAIGVHHELVAKYAGVFDEKEISAFLIFWTARHEYQASLALHAERYGLDGAKSLLTRDDAELAAKRIRIGDLMKRVAELESVLKETVAACQHIATGKPVKSEMIATAIAAIAKATTGSPK